MRFALIGVGYVAPRHIRAIHETGHELVAVTDPHDAVGVLDGYFPGALYFREFERFQRYITREPVDYVAVCSPNYLHAAHVHAALRSGASVICEKPLVLDPADLGALRYEESPGKRVHVLLQLRAHPAVLALRSSLGTGRHVVRVNYRAPRGAWYDESWKGDPVKSGGIVTNIGIHLFDLLLWLFGDVLASDVSRLDPRTASGRLRLQRADVEWTLSTEPGPAVRQLTVDGKAVDLSDGFDGLHAEMYRRILAGEGPGIEDARPAIELVHAMGAPMREAA